MTDSVRRTSHLPRLPGRDPCKLCLLSGCWSPAYQLCVHPAGQAWDIICHVEGHDVWIENGDAVEIKMGPPTIDQRHPPSASRVSWYSGPLQSSEGLDTGFELEDCADISTDGRLSACQEFRWIYGHESYAAPWKIGDRVQ